jgi:ketosteroid isomerase-like protein
VGQTQDGRRCSGGEYHAAVSEERIALVRAAVDSLNRGDWDGALQNAAPDVEYDLSRTMSPLRGVYRGIDEVRRVAAEFYGPWEGVRYEAHELIAAGEHVVMPYTSYFRGPQGIEVEAHATWVWTIRDGVLARLCLYQRRDEALEAAGAGRRRRGWSFLRGRGTRSR